MISNKVKETRREWGMSIAELARRSGLSRMTIINIENMNSTPNVKTVLAICRVLNQKVDDIFFEIDVNHDLQKGGCSYD